MKQPNRPKTNNLTWILAILFPRKNKPASKPVSDPDWMPKTPSATPAYSSTRSPTPLTIPLAGIKPLIFPKQKKPAKPIFQAGKLLPAFWTVASLLSFMVNVILIVVIVILGQQLFTFKQIIGGGLLHGLYENFILMDQAHIKTNISVSENVPVDFSLTISQDTVVTLTDATRINGAHVYLTSGGVAINSPANIILPAGTNLPVHLELTVPVQTTIPITINVPVDIPLEQTELHTPFVGLQNVISPYYWLLQPQIKNAGDLEICKKFNWFCSSYFR